MSSFAGGKRDPSDKDVVDTALREAGEELGVTVATNQVWGVLKPLRDMVRTKTLPIILHDRHRFLCDALTVSSSPLLYTI